MSTMTWNHEAQVPQKVEMAAPHQLQWITAIKFSGSSQSRGTMEQFRNALLEMPV